MLFDIRAELPDGTCRDFKQAGQENKAERWTAQADARARVEQSLCEEFGADALLRWSGMVVFVNRAVPLANYRTH